MFEQEKIIIESAWNERELLAKEEVREAIRRTVEAVDKGVLRCAEPIDLEASKWRVNEGGKKAIIRYLAYVLCLRLLPAMAHISPLALFLCRPTSISVLMSIRAQWSIRGLLWAHVRRLARTFTSRVA